MLTNEEYNELEETWYAIMYLCTLFDVNTNKGKNK